MRYDFICDNESCPSDGITEERFILLNDFEAEKDRQFCQYCNRPMRLYLQSNLPATRTDKQFMASAGVSDDGFGNDERSRRIARARAEAAGVNVNGMRFHPGLCRKGVPYDPINGWYSSRADVIRKAEAKGCNVFGCIEHTTPIRDKDLAALERPYRPAASVVARDAERIVAEKYGPNATKAQVENTVEELRDRHAGNAEVKGKVSLAD